MQISAPSSFSTVPTDIRAIKSLAANSLVDFDESAIRDALVRSAGEKLSDVAQSSATSMVNQITTIRKSAADFDSILERMKIVQSNVEQIHSNVGTVVHAVQGSSDDLEQMQARVRVLEQHLSAIDGLLRTVNDIADQTHLLSLNATIEAARAGDAGRGFAIVANEVKELATTTKNANLQIRETLVRITDSVDHLTSTVGGSVAKMQASVAAVEVTRKNASTIGDETNRFSSQLQDSLNNFGQLDSTSQALENEVQEICTIGKTFYYLVELMAMHSNNASINPLERLSPLVAASTFRAPERFTRPEREYVLTNRDVLVSATDTRGMIQFANNAFYEVAEYSHGELVGKPHNVIRHPDMPRAAFADMWATIQAGKLWQGYVANRSRTGRVYWVKANVFPCYEAGKIVGYISIRTAPEKDMIEKSKAAYRLVM